MSLNLLHVQSSLFGERGNSARLAENFLKSLRQAQSDLTITRRDLTPDTVPHLDAATFQAFGTPPEQRDADQRSRVALSDALIDELKVADLIVLGLPMYNFGVPSTLKAWFDHIARAGITFRYTASGPQGLLNGKRVVVIASRGGSYKGRPADTQTPYVNHFLGFLGLHEVRWVYAEGLAAGDANAVLADARRELADLAASLAPAVAA